MPSVDYEELVKNYYDNLNTTLRKFSPGPDFLETWVHDEDHNKSLLGIFESAEEAGVPVLTVAISRNLIDKIKREWLTDQLKTMGKVQWEELPERVKLEVHFRKP